MENTMIRKMILGAVTALTLGLVGLGLGARSASAEVTLNGTFPISAVFNNPCEPDANPIRVTGWYHRVDYTTPEGTLMMRYTAHYVGTDKYGNTYVVNNSRTMEHWAWPNVPPFSDLVVIRLISKGSGDNATIEVLVEYSTTYPPTPPAVTTVSCRG